jgi:hypothetical protein
MEKIKNGESITYDPEVWYEISENGMNFYFISF